MAPESLPVDPFDVDALLDHFDLDEAQYNAVLKSTAFRDAVARFAGDTLPLLEPYLKAGVGIAAGGLGAALPQPAGALLALLVNAVGQGGIAGLEHYLAARKAATTPPPAPQGGPS